MTKLEQAARQALDALEELFHSNSTKVAVEKYNTAHNALREALDHSGEADEMVVGWDRVKPEAIASDPLYQQGFVDGVEEGRNQVAEQAEQSQLADATLEPVAWANPSGGYLSARYMKGFATGLEKETYTIPLYAAPLAKQDTHATHVVRTKDPCHPWQDLTDDEIADIRMNIVAYALSKE